MARLVPCPTCRRHVATHEHACPFCDGELADVSPPAAPTDGRQLRRLGRAAIFAFGASVAAGCGGGVTPLYGAPAPDGGPDAGPEMIDDGGPGGFDAAYGAPPPPDGG